MKKILVLIGFLFALSNTPVLAFDVGTSPFAVVLPQPKKEEFTLSTWEQKREQEAEKSLENDTQSHTQVDEVSKFIISSSSFITEDDRKTLPIPANEVLGISTFYSGYHPGIDIRAPFGTSIRAIHAGRVVEVAYQSGGYGRLVRIQYIENESIVQNLYAHLKNVTVKVGDTVSVDTVIGTVGLSGRTTGPHLHLEIRQDDLAIDPIRYFNKGVIPRMVAKK